MRRFFVYTFIRGPVLPSKKVEHTVEVYLFPYAELIFGLCHIVEQKFQYQRTAQSSALNFKIGEAVREIGVSDIVYADKAWIFHCL